MASILKVDEMQGVTSAGDITITSEGGSATQSLQQGLAKAWASLVQTSTQTLNDSLNVTSITDNGTGETTVTYTNVMSNSNYSSQATIGNNQNRKVIYNANNTTRLKLEVWEHASNPLTADDAAHVCGQVTGDLA